MAKDTVMMIDPSELLRPETEFADKELSKFRDYSVDLNDPLKERVRQTYRHMHLNQTVDFVKGACIIMSLIIVSCNSAAQCELTNF